MKIWGNARRRLVGACREAQARSAAMTANAEVRRGARGRGLVMTGVGLAALAGMFQLVSSNVLAVNFTTGNNTFAVYSNYLDAYKAEGFLDPSNKQNGTNVGVADIGINQAKLAGLCAIAQESIGPLGTYSLIIRAGLGGSGQTIPDTYSGTGIPTGVTPNATDGTLPAGTGGLITANSLYLNSNALNGYGNLISGLNLGQSADSVAASAGLTLPSGQTAPTAGNFGLYAQQLNVAGLNGTSYGLNLAGQITLPQLNIQVVAGAKTQADCS